MEGGSVGARVGRAVGTTARTTPVELDAGFLFFLVAELEAWKSDNSLSVSKESVGPISKPEQPRPSHAQKRTSGSFMALGCLSPSSSEGRYHSLQLVMVLLLVGCSCGLVIMICVLMTSEYYFQLVPSSNLDFVSTTRNGRLDR